MKAEIFLRFFITNMKKTLLIYFVLVFNTCICAQDYLDKTPARYFTILVQNRHEEENLTSKNKIKKLYLIDEIKKDTSSVKVFNNKGQLSEGIEYSNGQRTKKWTYTYPENAKVFSIYEYKNGIPDKVPNEVWTWEYDKNKNLVSQKTVYKSGTELVNQYTYDQNNNMTSKLYYASKKLINSTLYKYNNNNLLTELIKRNHSNVNANETIVSTDTATYFYNDKKECYEIIYSNGNTKNIYNFTYSDGKLTGEDRTSFDNSNGNIRYMYKGNLLTNIIESVDGKGTAGTKIDYDTKGRISKTETYNDGGLVFRYSFTRNDQTRLVQEYTYDAYNFRKTIIRKENGILMSNYKYSFEYY